MVIKITNDKRRQRCGPYGSVLMHTYIALDIHINDSEKFCHMRASCPGYSVPPTWELL